MVALVGERLPRYPSNAFSISGRVLRCQSTRPRFGPPCTSVSTTVVVSPDRLPAGLPQYRPGLHIHGMLGFVRQMRPIIFHLGNPRVSIMWIHPILLLALFFRRRSNRAKSSRVGVAIPDSFASPVRIFPHSSRRGPSARSNASPRWPPAWSHRSLPSCLSPDPCPSVILRSRRTPCDASPHRSAFASARSSSDPEFAHPARFPETAAARTSPLPARQSRARIDPFKITNQHNENRSPE